MDPFTSRGFAASSHSTESLTPTRQYGLTSALIFVPPPRGKEGYLMSAAPSHLLTVTASYLQHQTTRTMNELPEELFCRNVTNVPRKDLLNLALVDRKLSRIATPSIYAKCKFNNHTCESRLRSLRCLLRTFVPKPDLRSLTCKLRIGYWKMSDPFGNMTGAPPMSLVELGELVSCTPTLNSYPPEFQRQLGNGLLDLWQDAIIVAILCLLPNLSSLVLDLDYRGRHKAEPNTQLTYSKILTAH